MLSKTDLKSKFDGKRVCIKMHFGGNLGYTTIPVIFAKILIDAVKAAGGRPFVTDRFKCCCQCQRQRSIQETLGCPLVGAQGVTEKYYKKVDINYGVLDYT